MKSILFVVLALSASVTAFAQGGSARVSANATWNSNASNSDRSSEAISALQLATELDLFSHRFALGRDDALFLSAGAAAEHWLRFDDLNRASVGPRLAWQHKFGLGALAPVLRAEAGVAAVRARHDERSGTSERAGLSWQQRWDEATRFLLSYEHLRHRATEIVYDQIADEVTIEATRQLGEIWSASAATRWRHGDVLSYVSAPRPDILALARVRDLVETFGRPQIVYAVEATSIGGTLGLSRSLGERASLEVGYEFRVTERSSLRYVNHLVSAGVSWQF